jgi:hypothetical protein
MYILMALWPSFSRRFSISITVTAQGLHCIEDTAVHCSFSKPILLQRITAVYAEIYHVGFLRTISHEVLYSMLLVFVMLRGSCTQACRKVVSCLRIRWKTLFKAASRIFSWVLSWLWGTSNPQFVVVAAFRLYPDAGSDNRLYTLFEVVAIWHRHIYMRENRSTDRPSNRKLQTKQYTAFPHNSAGVSFLIRGCLKSTLWGWNLIFLSWWLWSC